MELREFTEIDRKAANAKPCGDGKGPFIYSRFNSNEVEYTYIVGTDDDGCYAGLGIFQEIDGAPNFSTYVLLRSEDSEELKKKVYEFHGGNETLLESGSYEDIISALDSQGLEKLFQI